MPKDKAKPPLRISPHKPYFDNPFEKRRLKILNALFPHGADVRLQAQIDMTKARDHSLTIGDQRVGFDLDSIKAMNARGYDRRSQYMDITDRIAGQPMRLRIDNPPRRARMGTRLGRRKRTTTSKIICGRYSKLSPFTVKCRSAPVCLDITNG